jgi:hypothetical protein
MACQTLSLSLSLSLSPSSPTILPLTYFTLVSLMSFKQISCAATTGPLHMPSLWMVCPLHCMHDCSFHIFTQMLPFRVDFPDLSVENHVIPLDPSVPSPLLFQFSSRASTTL